MLLIQVKVIGGSFSQKQEIVKRLTDTMVPIGDENVCPVTRFIEGVKKSEYPPSPYRSAELTVEALSRPGRG